MGIDQHLLGALSLSLELCGEIGSMKWQFISFAQTDLGLVRSGNEDSALTCANLIAVADGMGGHAS